MEVFSPSGATAYGTSTHCAEQPAPDKQYSCRPLRHLRKQSCIHDWPQGGYWEPVDMEVFSPSGATAYGTSTHCAEQPAPDKQCSCRPLRHLRKQSCIHGTQALGCCVCISPIFEYVEHLSDYLMHVWGWICWVLYERYDNLFPYKKPLAWWICIYWYSMACTCISSCSWATKWVQWWPNVESHCSNLGHHATWNLPWKFIVPIQNDIYESSFGAITSLYP